MRFPGRIAIVTLSALLMGCDTPTPAQPTVERAPFGVLANGDSVHVYTMTNTNGVEVRAINYGGIILSLRVPDRLGQFEDIVLGYDSLEDYLRETPYFGAIVGRYGNRIAGGQFTLDGETYQLATNNGPNHLHGGVRGFDKVVWNAEPFVQISRVGVVLQYTSVDGEEGYPGTLDAQVTYTLTSQNELVVDYVATTDRSTPINLTQHSYFNLAGATTGDVLDHVLTLRASAFTPVDSTLIPLGNFADVTDTPFDFRAGVAIGDRIASDDTQLLFGGGYDHNFVLDRSGEGLVHAATVVEPTSGRVLQIHTTEPGIQFYSGNFLDGSIVGKQGAVYRHRYGFCLETQHFPDSPNQPSFPSTILQPDEEYRSRTVFVFEVM